MIAELFLEAGADIGTGVPPMHEAARMDAVDRIGVLLALGADPTRRWNDQTFFEAQAEANHSTHAMALLREPTR